MTSRELELKKERYGVWELCDDNHPNVTENRNICWHKSKHNLVWWCNMFVTTYDPRKSPPVMPFFLFPKQEKILQQFEDCYRAALY
jgi:hypothetical protein